MLTPPTVQPPRMASAMPPDSQRRPLPKGSSHMTLVVLFSGWSYAEVP